MLPDWLYIPASSSIASGTQWALILPMSTNTTFQLAGDCDIFNFLWNVIVLKCLIYNCIFFFFLFLLIFRAASVAYGSSQARGQIGAVATNLHHSHSNAGSESVNYTAACSNAGSLTSWAGPGMEPKASWIPVGFASAEPQGELPQHSLNGYTRLHTASYETLQGLPSGFI